MSDPGGLRWIPPLRLSGGWQMAIDEWLLDQATSPGRSGITSAVLRFYTWSRPTLSLGFHQQRLAPHWLELQRRGVLQLVRRPSGGRAVLHGGELTYALVWPGAPARRREAYRQACRWLEEGFAALGMPLQPGVQPADPHHFSCFASSTAADLVHASGGKRIGSAQLWRRGVLLQHGSILLAPPAELWQTVLLQHPPPLPKLPCGLAELIARLRQAAQQHLPVAAQGICSGGLTPAEWTAIAARRHRYRLGPH